MMVGTATGTAAVFRRLAVSGMELLSYIETLSYVVGLPMMWPIINISVTLH